MSRSKPSGNRSRASFSPPRLRTSARADAVLREGGRALIDATYHADAPRRGARELARRRRVPVIHLELTIDRAVAHERIRARHDDPSEADTAVHDLLVARWEDPGPETAAMRRRELEHLRACHWRGEAPAGFRQSID